MALAGPPFGLRSNISEGKGLGRCVAILAGGPSGGHLAPVKCAVGLKRYLIFHLLIIFTRHSIHIFRSLRLAG